MILNPPHITDLLRRYQQACTHLRADELPASLAWLFSLHLGHQQWPEFIETYALYLQSIDFDHARAAWGINQSSELALTAAAKPTTH